MDNNFAPMNDEEYNKSFLAALIEGYRHRDPRGLHQAESAALALLELPGYTYTPLVFHGQTLMVAVAESRANNVAGFINDIYHAPDPIAVPVVLEIEAWRGEWTRLSLVDGLNWFRAHIVGTIGEETSTLTWRPFTVACEAAVSIAASDVPPTLAIMESLSSSSHRELHHWKAFPGKNHHGEEDVSEEGDSDSLIDSIDRFLRDARGS